MKLAILALYPRDQDFGQNLYNYTMAADLPLIFAAFPLIFRGAHERRQLPVARCMTHDLPGTTGHTHTLVLDHITVTLICALVESRRLHHIYLSFF